VVRYFVQFTVHAVYSANHYETLERDSRRQLKIQTQYVSVTRVQYSSSAKIRSFTAYNTRSRGVYLAHLHGSTTYYYGTTTTSNETEQNQIKTIWRQNMNSSMADSSDINRYPSSAPIKKLKTENYSVRVKVEPREELEWRASTDLVTTLGRNAVAIKRKDEERSHDIPRRAPSDNIYSVSVRVEIQSEPSLQQLHSVSSDTFHVACFGPVLGQFRSFARVLKEMIWNENSKIDACFCVGPFFHSDPAMEPEAINLMNGGYELPCPVYFTDEGILPNVVTQDKLVHSYNCVPNLHYLEAPDGIGDIVSLLDGRLSVAFTSPKFSFFPNSVLERKCTDSTYNGCDLLLTSEWGLGIHNILDTNRCFPSNESPNVFFAKIFAQESFDVTRVALMVRPQFHVTPSTASLGYSYFQTSSFSTGLNSSIKSYCSGFYSLSSISDETGNERKDKCFILLSPTKETKAGCDINPYRAYEIYLNQSTMPLVDIGHNAVSSPESHVAFDNRSISHARNGPASKVFSIRYQSEDNAESLSQRNSASKSNQTGGSVTENFPGHGSNIGIRDRTNLLNYQVTSPNFSGFDDGAQCDQTPNEDPIGDNTSDKGLVDTATLVDHSGASAKVHKLIYGAHYNQNLYKEPELHEKILQGNFEGALDIIKCNKILISVVKDEHNRIISASPEIFEVESFDECCNLPIHSLLLNNNNFENRIGDQNRLKLLKYLLKHYPEGACTLQVTSDLPLSLACNPSLNFDSLGYSLSINYIDETVIRTLTDAYPTATKVMYEGERSILHILLEHRPSVELVKFIVETSESAAYAEEDSGAVIQGSILEHFDSEEQLPLHTAIQYYASCDVIKYLIEKFPLGTREEMVWGYLPLHCAARWGCSESVMDALLESFPEAVVRKDEMKLAPFELILSHEEMWIPNFDIPEVSCDDERRSRIISRKTETRSEAQIPPRRLMPPFQMLTKMIEAYLKFEGQQCKSKKTSSKLQAILKTATGKIRQKIAALRGILQAFGCCTKVLDDVEAYLFNVKLKGVPPSPL
jgi:hypothetical protein